MPIVAVVSEPSSNQVPVPADPRDAVPTAVRITGWIATVQGALGFVAAVGLVVRAMGGHQEDTVVISGYGTAAWFAVVGGAVLAAGIGLLRGRRWGRGLVVMAEILLLLVAWYVGVDSARPLAGIAVAAVSLLALVMLFRRDALTWYTG